jgi:esterase/lipase superfamily enzyme/TRAP-type C4-dicarboxylate transport system substrate-binding protein
MSASSHHQYIRFVRAVGLVVGCWVIGSVLTREAPAQTPQMTIHVLIDQSFQSRAMRFLEELNSDLAPQAREAVRFEPSIVSPPAIVPLFASGRWEMAIISSGALASAQTKTTVAGFEVPFVFRGVASVRSLQQSHLGRAALSNVASEGVTGLVYLNAGVALVTGRGQLASPDDLKGRKVAAYSPALVQTLQKFGSSPVTIASADVPSALKAGDVDSLIVSTGNSENWALADQQFLLTDGLKAQVAVVLTQDASWGRIPFVYRAMIGDAAIAASQRLDQALAETESSVLNRARSSGATLQSFSNEDATRAATQWISDQPEQLRDIYSKVLDFQRNVNQPNPPSPGVPGRGGQSSRLYFATTREDTGSADYRYRFGDVRTDIVKCGQIQFSANPSGQTTVAIAGPVTTNSTPTSKECGDLLNGVLASSKRMLIFVHGFNNRFSDAVDRAMALKTALGNDTEVVLWSWPSKRDGLAGNYSYDKESVGGSWRQSFVRFLRTLKPASEQKPLSILAHSMGSWYTIGTLVVLSDEDDRPVIDNVVFAAPDVPTDEFRNALADLSRVAKHRTLYACGWDWALLMSQDINAYPRAGTGGDTDIIVSDGLESIDVDAAWLSTNHSYVFDPGKVLADLSALVLTESDAGARGLQEKPKSPWHYWRFR